MSKTTKGSGKTNIRTKGYTLDKKARPNIFRKKPVRSFSTLGKLLDAPATSVANIFYDGQSCYLRNTGLVGAIDIKYTGTLYASSDLPDEFMFMEGNFQIIIVNWGRDNHSEDLKLFDYVGSFQIVNAVVVTPAIESVRCTVTFNYENTNVDISDLGSGSKDLRWGKNYSKYGSVTSEWQDIYSPTPDSGGGIKKKKNIIMHNKQIISKNKLFTVKGEPYEGKITHYSNGTIFSNDPQRKTVQLYKQRELDKGPKRRRVY